MYHERASCKTCPQDVLSNKTRRGIYEAVPTSMLTQPGVAARPGAGRTYERNIYPQTTPLNRSDDLQCNLFTDDLENP